MRFRFSLAFYWVLKCSLQLSRCTMTLLLGCNWNGLRYFLSLRVRSKLVGSIRIQLDKDGYARLTRGKKRGEGEKTSGLWRKIRQKLGASSSARAIIRARNYGGFSRASSGGAPRSSRRLLRTIKRLVPRAGIHSRCRWIHITPRKSKWRASQPCIYPSAEVFKRAPPDVSFFLPPNEL